MKRIHESKCRAQARTVVAVGAAALLSGCDLFWTTDAGGFGPAGSVSFEGSEYQVYVHTPPNGTAGFVSILGQELPGPRYYVLVNGAYYRCKPNNEAGCQTTVSSIITASKKRKQELFSEEIGDFSSDGGYSPPSGGGSS